MLLCWGKASDKKPSDLFAAKKKKVSVNVI